jgi:hypothetical protein
VDAVGRALFLALPQGLVLESALGLEEQIVGGLSGLADFTLDALHYFMIKIYDGKRGTGGIFGMGLTSRLINILCSIIIPNQRYPLFITLIYSFVTPTNK